jgi:hypothetical protein
VIKKEKIYVLKYLIFAEEIYRAQKGREFLEPNFLLSLKRISRWLLIS